jgi:hypothetical protein
VVRVAGIAAASLVLTAAAPARANGRFPASNQIAFSPSDADLVLLRTTFGVLLSHDAGVSWSWLCEDVLGTLSSSTEDPLLGVTAASIVATPGLADGLSVSVDHGCDWSPTGGPLAGQLVRDLVVRPDAPDVVLALTSTYGLHAGPDGGAGYAQQVYESDDDGASWSARGVPIDPGALATTIEVAAADPARIYVSAVRAGGEVASLFVSTDAGASWTERPVPIDPANESAIYIGGVDPVDPDLVYIRTLGSSSRLLVTADAGQTFASALTLQGQMTGFALSPDGSTVYAGDVEEGLFVAPRDGVSLGAFEHPSTIRVQCLATHGDDLWACSDEASGFVAGVSNDDGATFAAKVHLVAQPMLACAADAEATAQCGGAPRQSFCALLPGCDSSEGGTPGDAGAPEGPTSSGGGGCSTASRDGGTGELTAAGCAAIAFLAGAARARTRPRGRRGRRGPR